MDIEIVLKIIGAFVLLAVIISIKRDIKDRYM